MVNCVLFQSTPNMSQSNMKCSIMNGMQNTFNKRNCCLPDNTILRKQYCQPTSKHSGKIVFLFT